MAKSKQTDTRSSKQNNDESPVIENPRLAKMGEGSDRPRLIGGKILQMPVHPVLSRGGKKMMNPIMMNTEREADKFERTDIDYPEQEERKEMTRKRTSKQRNEGYLRIRLRVKDRKMSLVEVHKVDGPLITENEIQDNLVYEASISSKRIAIGSIIDVGVNRSYPNPGVPGQEGHFFIEVPSYEFDARLPIEDLSLSLLPKVEIAVYRVKGQVNKSIGEKSVAVEFIDELREVARLKGIAIKRLSQKSQTEIRNLLRKKF